jgi:hypothetical protein
MAVCNSCEGDCTAGCTGSCAGNCSGSCSYYCRPNCVNVCGSGVYKSNPEYHWAPSQYPWWP